MPINFVHPLLPLELNLIMNASLEPLLVWLSKLLFVYPTEYIELSFPILIDLERSELLPPINLVQSNLAKSNTLKSLY